MVPTWHSGPVLVHHGRNLQSYQHVPCNWTSHGETCMSVHVNGSLILEPDMWPLAAQCPLPMDDIALHTYFTFVCWLSWLFSVPMHALPKLLIALLVLLQSCLPSLLFRMTWIVAAACVAHPWLVALISWRIGVASLRWSGSSQP